MARWRHEMMDENEMQSVVENAADFNAAHVYDIDGTTVAIANPEVAGIIAAALEAAGADVPMGQKAWVWAGETS